jgi:hypothetical protein
MWNINKYRPKYEKANVVCSKEPLWNSFEGTEKSNGKYDAIL